MDQALATAEPFVGTWEEISSNGDRFKGKTVKVSVIEPDPFANIPGIIRPTSGNGTIEELMALVATFEPFSEEEGDIWEAIAENRKMRRELAQEKEY